ncbi:MAG: phosphate transporter [Gemmataceae bacterium]|nr:phosphate transporter [Gemmataceae bacterium]
MTNSTLAVLLGGILPAVCFGLSGAVQKVTAKTEIGSRLGLPVSTTHFSVGSLFGIGVVSRTARVRMVLAILVAWATTLPTGAALAAAAYLVLRSA